MTRPCAKVGLLVNGHGGNDPTRAVLYELANELPGLKVNWCAVSDGGSGERRVEKQLRGEVAV
jgi:creatinine amidohydrolase/Fe(II)-dependent formamide hydrolase-like protein